MVKLYSFGCKKTKYNALPQCKIESLSRSTALFNLY